MKRKQAVDTDLKTRDPLGFHERLRARDLVVHNSRETKRLLLLRPVRHVRSHTIYDCNVCQLHLQLHVVNEERSSRGVHTYHFLNWTSMTRRDLVESVKHLDENAMREG
jgi:hypothetical protein